MTPLIFREYLEQKSHFAVSRALAQSALDLAQPLAMEALGIHTQRQTLVEGELPAHIVMTKPETNGGWGELMPLWFKAYDRPVPLHCLDNWALFALLYRSSFGLEADTSAFTVDNLLRVVVGADLLIPFLPSTDGAGNFLRHGALPILLGILWLEPDARDAWLKMHEQGARIFTADFDLHDNNGLADRLGQIETAAWLVSERALVAGDAAVSAFLTDSTRVTQYSMLFSGLCLSVSALAAALGGEWRQWVFQAVNVGYRTPEFALSHIADRLKMF